MAVVEYLEYKSEFHLIMIFICRCIEKSVVELVIILCFALIMYYINPSEFIIYIIKPLFSMKL